MGIVSKIKSAFTPKSKPASSSPSSSSSTTITSTGGQSVSSSFGGGSSSSSSSGSVQFGSGGLVSVPPVSWTFPSGGGGGGSSGGGGGGSSGGGSSIQGPLQPGTSFTSTGGTTKAPTTNEISSFANQVKVQDAINRQNLLIQQQRLRDDMLGTQSTSNSFGNVVEKVALKEINKLEGQQQSVKAPTEQQLEYLRGKVNYTYGGGSSGGGGVKEVYNELKERFTTSPKISAEVASNAYRGIKNQQVADFYWKQDTAKQKQITANIEETITKRIQDKKNELQARANAGENVDALNKELREYQNKVADEVFKDANKEYNDWFNEFSTTGAGSQFEKNAIKDVIKFNARFTAPRAKEIFKSATKSFTGGAVVGGGATAVFGGLGLFNNMVGRGAKAVSAGMGRLFSAPAQYVIATAGALNIIRKQSNREIELQRTYGFTEGESYRVARQEAQTSGINFVTGYGAGFAGAYAGSKIVGVGLNAIKTKQVNTGTKEFINKLQTDRATQDRVFTDANLKKGFIIETIQGVKVKIPITKAMSKAVYAQREGLTQNVQALGGGVNQQFELQQSLLKNVAFKNALKQAGIQVDRGFTIAEIQSRTATGITRQNIGRLNRVYQATYREGNIVKGFTFKINSAGKLTNIKLLKGTINPVTGTITTQASQLIRKPVTVKRGVLEVTGKVVKPAKVTIGKFEQRDVRLLGGGKGRVITSDVAIAQAKGAKVGKVNSAFKDQTAQEFLGSGQIQVLDPSKVKIIQKGASRRISVTKDANVFGQKGSQELFAEVIRTTTPKTAVEILPQPKPPKPAKGKTDSLFSFDLPKTPSSSSSTTGGKQDSTLLFTQEIAKSLEQSAGLGFVQASKGSQLSQLKVTGTALNIPKVQPSMLFNPLETQQTKIKEKPFITEGRLSSGLIFAEGTKSRDDFMFGSISAPVSRTASRTNIQQQSALATQSIFQPLMTQTLIKPLSKSSLKPIPPIASDFFGGGLGEIQVGGGEKGKGSKGSLFGETKYTASLGNVLLGTKRIRVTKEQAKALGQVTYTGLELRPQIEIIKEDKKRKGLFD